MSIIRKAISRMRAGEDIGLDRSGQGGRQQTINPDGTYNLERKTGRLFGNFFLYHWILTTSWTRYWFTVLGFYAFMNLIFASIYMIIGHDSLNAMPDQSFLSRFLYCFFFSAQSFTTVGYGAIHPDNELSNMVATVEAFTGLMTFALATGTLYGRFSKPISRIRYSNNILIAPFEGGLAMQFMIANELSSALMEMEARVNIGWSEEEEPGKKARRFQQVKLQIDKIAMFPTSWTINHPIDEESALYGKTLEEMREMDVEVFILIKGFDDIFSQTIYSRHSYMVHQFVWGAKFKVPFHVNEKGKVVMDLNLVGEHYQVNVPAPVPQSAATEV